MASIVSTRFVECLQMLLDEGKVRSQRQFALSLGFHPQNLADITKGKRDVPIELLRKAIELYRMNPLYLYAGEGSIFLDQEGNDQFRVLKVVTDQKEEERIIHVPVPAQAGYTEQMIDEVFLQNLPSYNLPDTAFQAGTFRSFDVSGDSMEPTLREGDKVICSFLDPSYWNTSIRDHHVYVIIGRDSVVVKRVVNNIQKHRHLMLQSDNDFFKTYRVNINDIREVWYVRAVLSTFSHLSNVGSVQGTSIHHLKETIDEQTALIKHLNSTIEQLLNKNEKN
jgi:hypothetical protein